MMVNYYEYLRSAEWQGKRFAAIQRARNRCQVCYSDGNLDVHHRTYERLGDELASDLTVLCRTCHTTFHSRMAQAPQKSHHAERTLLLVALKSEDALDKVLGDFGPADFECREYRDIFEWLAGGGELPASASPTLDGLLKDPEEFGHPVSLVANIRESLAKPGGRK